MTPEEITDEARAALRLHSIDVELTIEREEFTVPAMPGLTFSTVYEASGCVTPDLSGDRITPNGPPAVVCLLGDVLEYVIRDAITGEELPKWLQDHLITEYAGEIDAAFLAEIGGQDQLNALAIEKALA